MIRIVVAGIAGRMGEEILRAAGEQGEVRIVAGTVRRGGPARDLASRLLLPVFDDTEAALAQGADAMVDFTEPEACVRHAEVCARHGTPFVTGTTGLDDAQRASLEEAARSIPLLHAPNLSVGIHLLRKLVAEAASALGDSFDVEIVEAHHRHKKDAPSGTALHLAEAVAAATGGDLSVEGCYGRKGAVGPRRKGEVGIFALRGGDVVGEHTVYFLGEGERIELTHRASNRRAFARGALRAARWIVGRPPGLYGMQDVLR